MTIQETIEKAISGGYLFKARFRPSSMTVAYENEDEMTSSKTLEEVFLDHSFWKSLGKSMDWGDGIGTDPESWQDQWHNFIETLVYGDKPEKFFKKLKP